jgi:sugar O-acyltransferase (sialic acid O-acetyltransferase NeuD family)
MKRDKLIIVGDSAFAEIAYEYFTYESDCEVVAFSVEKAFLKRKELFGLPIVPFEDLEELYDPKTHKIFVALTYRELNAVRTRLYKEAQRKGFKPISYISPRAFVWRNVEIGENCFIFEGNVIQPFVKLGNNVILWSGNHIGHHSIIKDNCFISSHVVVSGFVEIGENCFLGVNSCIIDSRKIAKDCVIGAGAVVLKDTEVGKVYVGNPARPLEKSSYESFKGNEG